MRIGEGLSCCIVAANDCERDECADETSEYAYGTDLQNKMWFWPANILFLFCLRLLIR